MYSNAEGAPRNFNWIVKNELAAMAWPQTHANLKFLVSVGIKHLVTLSPELRPPVYSLPELQWTEIGIKEYRAPSLSQIQEFIGICQRSLDKGESVGVHCRMGKGRTGVMSACYLVRFCGHTPEMAIDTIRLARPESIETLKQEKVIVEYYNYLRDIKS